MPPLGRVSTINVSFEAKYCLKKQQKKTQNLNSQDFLSPSDTSSASEDEGSLRRKAALSAVLAQSLQSPDYWINRSVQSSSTSSSASSTLSHGEPKTQPQLQPAVSVLADVLAHTRIGSLD